MSKKTEELSKRYEPEKFESKWYNFWEKNNLFKVEIDNKKIPYAIMMPPPNVTGVLHMGHALQDTIQDILIRYKRMKGFNALWQPGKDHAGIATQNVVEKKLLKKGIKREDLGREKFLKEVWKLVEEHRDVISKQKRKLGGSADWSREKFTLDPDMYKSVMTAFVNLYNKGLIYKGKYIVNWCPRCHTALSNEEVVNKDEEGKLWYIKYKFSDGSKIKIEGFGEIDGIIVATTRPETMLGDTAVAVNPEDERYKNIIGKKVILPIMNKEIEIIADSYVDKKFGTGAVKITPAHDPNDFEVGKRHNLEQVVVIDSKGKMNENTPSKYQGLDRYEAREIIINDLEKNGLLLKIEKHQHSVGHCSRCDTTIEPYLSDQWFVKMKPLAKKAIEVVKEDKIKIFPPRWKKMYFEWLENIRDWCISRQLWWGHRIPVYYCKDCGKEFVSVDKPEKCPYCGSSNIKQDEDVLDTWFSSWLWPISTLGWPEDTEELKYFYPTDVLVSGYDILFFWIIRMVIAGLEFKGEIPFKNIYLTGLIRDKYGRKMSKSLGNGIDPLEMVEKYGADAVRFTLAYLSTEGQDINLDPVKFEMGRNFANKIWNVFRFSYQFIKDIDPEIINSDFETTNFDIVDKWILTKLMKLIKTIENDFERYKFQYISYNLYQFIWHDFCDWYIELAKVTLFKGSEKEKLNKKKTLYFLIMNIIKMLHPFMPFLTEEIYQTLNHKKSSIVIEDYPEYNEKLIFENVFNDFQSIQEIITGIRNLKSELNILNRKDIDVYIKMEQNSKILDEFKEQIKILAGIKDIIPVKESPSKKFATKVTKIAEIYIIVEGIVDLEEEKKRIEKQLKKLEGELEKVNKKLSNKQFLEKAKKEAIEKQKERKNELELKINKLKEKIEKL